MWSYMNTIFQVGIFCMNSCIYLYKNIHFLENKAKNEGSPVSILYKNVWMIMHKFLQIHYQFVKM